MSAAAFARTAASHRCLDAGEEGFMPVLIEKEPGPKKGTVQTSSQAKAGNDDPLADQQLYCPFCGCTYQAQEGCFCLRVVGWDGRPLGE